MDLRYGRDCNLCPIGKWAGNRCVGYRGNPNPTILIVGEAPGSEEDTVGQPFVGKAGKELEAIIKDAEIPMEDIAFSNAVRCFPRDEEGKPRPPTEHEYAACCTYLFQEVTKLDPKVIVTVGKSATSYLLGTGNRTITSIRGTQTEVEVWGKTYKAIPTIHPAAVLRGMYRYRPDIRNDIRDAYDWAHNRYGKKMPETEWVKDIDRLQVLVDRAINLYKDGRIKCVGFDLETNGLNAFVLPEDLEQERDPEKREKMKASQIITFGFAYEVGRGYHVDLRVTPEDECVAELRRLFEVVPVAIHNAMFDLGWMAHHWDIHPTLYMCTMVGSYLVFGETHAHSLESVARTLLGFVNWKQVITQDLRKKGIYAKTFEDVDPDILAEYGATDAVAHYRLVEPLEERIEEYQLQTPHQIIRDASKEFLRVMVDGIPADRQYLEETITRYETRLEETYKQMLSHPTILKFIYEEGWNKTYDQLVMAARKMTKTDRLYGISTLVNTFYWNPNSHKQRGKLFHHPDYLALPFFAHTESDPPEWMQEVFPEVKYNCSIPGEAYLHYYQDESLPEETREIVWSILTYRKIQKLLGFLTGSKGVESFRRPNSNRVNVIYKPTGTVTGRFSTTDISFQTIPRGSDIKRVFRSSFYEDGGVLISADYSQIEVRVLACLSQDENLLKAYEEGLDIHRYVASQIFSVPLDEVTKEMRAQGKGAVFNTLYEGGAATLAKNAGCSIEEAQAVISGMFKRFPSMKDYIKRNHELAKAQGYIRSVFGRIRFLPGAHSLDEAMVAEAMRQGNNHTIQSAANDITLLSILVLCERLRELEKQSRLFGFVHDSVTVDIFPGELLDVLRLQRWAMEDEVPNQLPFITIDLPADFDICPRFGASLSVEDTIENFSSKVELRLPDIREPGVILSLESEEPCHTDLDSGRICVAGRFRDLEELTSILRRHDPGIKAIVREIVEDRRESGLEIDGAQARYVGFAGGNYKCKAVLEVT